MSSEPQGTRRSSAPPPTEIYDLVVIGAGPSGEHAAATAVSLGKRVALVEMIGDGPQENIAAPPSRTRLDFIRISTELEARGVRCVGGKGRFEDSNTFRVERDGTVLQIKGRMFLIATGSMPSRPKLVPWGSSRVHDTDGIVRLEEVPPTLVILGAGARGCEYASYFAKRGTKVTLVSQRARILPYLDAEAVERLIEAMKSSGIEYLSNMRWDAIHAFEDLVTVDLADGRTLDADHLLFAAGRVGRSSNLGLERIGVLPDGRGYIPVDDSFRTEVPHIFAAGGVIGPPALSGIALEQGRRAVLAAFEVTDYPTRDAVIPYGLFSAPEIGGGGLTEEAARAAGIDHVVGRGSSPDGTAFTKLVVERSTKRILGAFFVGPHATELVHIGLTAMSAKATIDVFRTMVFNHPTQAESYRTAAESAAKALAPI